MKFRCVLSRVNTVIFNDDMVDIDLSVDEKSSAEAMAENVNKSTVPDQF